MGLFDLFRRKKQPEPEAQPAAAPQPEAPRPRLSREEYLQRKYYNCDLTPLPGCRQMQLTAAGTAQRKKTLAALGQPNPEYKLDKMQLCRAGMLDKDVYALTFGKLPAHLLPEPDNPKDKNAVKIMLDGYHVGYIKARECEMVLSLLNAGKIQRVQAQPYGGDYRTLTYDGGYLPDGERADRDELHTEVTRENIGVAIFIDYVPD